jgi:glycosyltransferase involved in cell wall biosynthesis
MNEEIQLMERVKILYIIGSFGVGGKERQLAELIKGLPKNKYSISFIVKNADAYYLNGIENVIDHFYSLEEKRFGFRSLLKIYKKIKEYKPDIIHSWASLATLHVIITKIFFNFKLIDSSVRDSTKPDLLKSIIIKIITFYSDKIIANSKAGLLCYKIPGRKSTFIHNGFDFNRINYLEPVENIKYKFKIKSSKVVGMVARIDFQKDYPTFIKAAIIILLKRSDVKFVIVGDGEDKEKIQSMIAPGHKEKFIFAGRQSNVESIVNCFDVAVLATFTEGISNAVIEYMALEKPVIVTNGGGTSELVKDGVTGYLVREGDVYQLAEKILFLLDNQDICLQMSAEGGKRIFEDFNLKKMIDRFQDEYEKILKGN